MADRHAIDRAKTALREEADVDKAVTQPQVRRRLLRASMDAIRIMQEIMETGEPREQADAARVVLNAWCRLPENLPDEELSEAERQARLDAALETPAAKEYLARKGFVQVREMKQ